MAGKRKYSTERRGESKVKKEENTAIEKRRDRRRDRRREGKLKTQLSCTFDARIDSGGYVKK